MRRQQGKQKKSHKQFVMPKHIIGLVVFFLTVLIFTILSIQNIVHQTKSAKQHIVTKLYRISTPTPTIDMSLVNTYKTYTSMLYGFTVSYPALGEDMHGNITPCGSAIEELVLNQNITSIPKIHIDSLFQITIHPWGSQLHDYLIEKDQSLASTTPYLWIGKVNVDEAIIFTARNTQGYFKDVLALYKKGNLIYQIEKPQDYTAGCQMIIDPRDGNQTSLAKSQSDVFQTMLLPQYQQWNEATSIEFSK